MFPVQLPSVKPLVCLKTENLESAMPPAAAAVVMEQKSQQPCLCTADQVSSSKLFIQPQSLKHLLMHVLY